MEPSPLRRALELARASAADGGGPFGAVIARGDEILSEGRNRVVPWSDPSAHAEIVAIRAACTKLGTHVLTGCTLYASCEPCPMCLSAAWWARLDGIVAGAGREDAAAAGFDDAAMFLALRDGAPRPPVTRALTDEAAEILRAWARDPGRQTY